MSCKSTQATVASMAMSPTTIPTSLFLSKKKGAFTGFIT